MHSAKMHVLMYLYLLFMVCALDKKAKTFRSLFLTTNVSRLKTGCLSEFPLNVALGLPLRLYESHQPLFSLMPLKLSKS